MSELGHSKQYINYDFPKGFKLPYTNSEDRNEDLQVRADMLNENIILRGVQDLLK